MSRRHDPTHARDRVLNVAVKRPVFAGPLVIHRRRAVCHLADREVAIEAPARLLAALASRCDGRTSFDQVVEALGGEWDRSELSRLLEALCRERVVCEASNLAVHWWRHVKNPRPTGAMTEGAAVAVALAEEAFNRVRTPAAGLCYREVGATPFIELLGARGSTRNYADRPVLPAIVLRLLWAAYGAGERRTVPSAGGIYPLQVDFINLRATGDLGTGVYRLHYLAGGRIALFRTSERANLAVGAFCEPDMLEFAQGIVAISGDLARSAAKYEARASLYLPLEAGHAAQNVLLAAAEARVGAVEVGGFLDDRLGDLLGYAGDLMPLTSIIFGALPTDDERACVESAPEMEFRWVDAPKASFAPPFLVSAARVKGSDTDWSFGRSVNPRMACIKASAEAQERWSCTLPIGLQEGRMKDLADAPPPQDIVAYSPGQYARQDFRYLPFDPTALYLWKAGEDISTGRSTAVLADHVYFSGFLEGPRPYTSASSSGVAAYTSRQGVIERAVLELVERDAFMTTWLSRATRPTIDPASVSATIAARLRALASSGVEIVLKDHSTGIAPVVFVFAQSRKAGFTLTTAASAFDAEEALENALMEAEWAVAMRLAGGVRPPIDPGQVDGPEDHLDLYAQRRFYRRADFLGGGGPTVALKEVGSGCAQRWDDLTASLTGQGLRILWFDLTPPGASLHQGRSALHIGRAIIPGLLPISFGCGLEPLATFDARLPARTRRRRADRSTPAPYSFPHPFG
jgi:ribosomal protein S12 methylthiotransferase accessory factor